MRSRVDGGELARRARAVSLEEAIAAGEEGRLDPSTIAGYRSEIRKLYKSMCELTAEDCMEENICFPIPDLESDIRGMEIFVIQNLSKSFFIRECYVSAMEGVRHFTKTRSALLNAQKKHGSEEWAKDPQVMRLLAGYERMGTIASEQPLRGQITLEILERMIDALPRVSVLGRPIPAETRGALALAWQVQFGAALRIEELTSLVASDLDPNQGLRIIAEKQSRVPNGAPTKDFKEIMKWPRGCVAAELLRQQAKKHPVGLLFPTKPWNIKYYNAAIKEVARELKLDEIFPNVIFRSSHCLRHGGVGLAVEQLTSQGKSKEETASILRMSDTMRRHYALTNEQRSQQFARRMAKNGKRSRE